MNNQNRKGSRLMVIALWCVLFLNTQVAAAGKTFACHVMTVNGHPGVFFVQTEDRREAGEAALRASVAAGGRDKAQVAEVVQCINYPGGRFSDATMQAYLKSLPR